MTDAIAFTSRQVKTMADGTLRLTIDVEPAEAQNAFRLFGQPGLLGAMVRIKDDAGRQRLQETTIAADSRKHGDHAKHLKLSGFFRRPEVWRACGTDEEFLSWTRQQPCAKSGSRGHGSNRVVAAHNRRVSEGAGTGIKPKYCAIPLLDSLHRHQHQHGESAIETREWWDKQRIRHVEAWAWEQCKTQIGKDSMADVSPEEFQHWCRERDIKK